MVLVILLSHFANKCPHKKNINDEDYSNNKQTYKRQKNYKKSFQEKTYAPKKTSHHQMKMKSVTVRQK
jgi:hypothetical protein